MQLPTCIDKYILCKKLKKNNAQSIKIKNIFFIFRNNSLPTNISNVTVLLTTSTEPTEGKNNQMHVTVLIAVTLLCVFLIISMAVNIFLLCTNKGKNYMALHHLTAIWLI